MPVTQDTYQVIAFYRFVKLDDCETYAPTLKQHMLDRDIMGTILLAEEGINGTISGQPESISKLLEIIHSHPGLEDSPYKSHYQQAHV